MPSSVICAQANCSIRAATPTAIGVANDVPDFLRKFGPPSSASPGHADSTASPKMLKLSKSCCSGVGLKVEGVPSPSVECMQITCSSDAGYARDWFPLPFEAAANIRQPVCLITDCMVLIRAEKPKDMFIMSTFHSCIAY